MFKSRSGSQGNPTTHPPQSIEAVRRRARHRLIGASVLVLIGVLGFPLLFDTQPRPISVDIPIEIPAKNPAPALVLPQKAAPASTEPVAAAVPPAAETSVAAPAPVSSADSLGDREELVASAPETPATRPAPAKPVPAAEAPARSPAEPRSEPATAKPPVSPAAEALRAQALLDGKPADVPAASAERIVVQVGAFADPARAREVRLKVEAAGLKTYTHVAQTAEGSRIRVRVGPFATRAEAEKAAARIKATGLPTAILTL